MFPRDTLEGIRTEQGAFWWAAQYQGNPEPMTGNMFPRDYFQTFTETDDAYHLAGKTIPVEDCDRFAIADTALSDKRTADFTVIAMFATTPAGELLLLERWRGRYSGPAQVKLLQRVYEEWAPAYIGIEGGSAGLHTIQELQGDLPIKELHPEGSKVARATTAATYLEQGKIWFPKKPWRDEWDAELVQFPHGKHDDQVDVLAYAALQITNRQKRVSLAGWDSTAGLLKPAGPFSHYHGGLRNIP
jgi:predicted phage terminase large subunit-like protein